MSIVNIWIRLGRTAISLSLALLFLFNGRDVEAVVTVMYSYDVPDWAASGMEQLLVAASGDIRRETVANAIHHGLSGGEIDDRKSRFIDGVKWHGSPNVLIWAASSGNTAVLELLAAIDGIPLTTPDKELDQTPLHHAAKNGHDLAVRILLGSRVNIDPIYERRMTPLHLAAEGGHSDVIDELLNIRSHGQRVAVSLRDARGQTPLYKAILRGHSTVVKTLLLSGLIDDEDKQAAWQLAHEKCDSQSVSLLRDYWHH
nr:secrectory protein [Plasmodiophora brassicae]